MLKYLHIENIAVIEKSDIEFKNGFIVLTGETGAGKSIIIDALNAVLGERTSKELIRSGCERAEVSAIFGSISESAEYVLNENGFETDENGEILIKRVLSSTSNGSVKINGKPATVGLLKVISRELVDIHGQHDNRNLLDEQQHLGYIDLIAENEITYSNYYNEFKKFNNIRRELSELECDEDEKQRRIELLKFQISELEDASVRIGETEELKKRLTLAENFEKSAASLEKGLQIIKGDDDFNGAITLLNDAAREIAGVKSDEFQKDSAKIEELVGELYGITDNIRKFLENSNYSEQEAAQTRERLDFIHRLMLKYGNSEEKMLQFLENAKKQLETITFADEKYEQLSIELENSKEQLVLLADSLSKTRKTAAVEFEKSVCDGLNKLNMPNVKFLVEFSKGRYTKFGCDEVRFLISANAGEEPRPLSKIASGGELSRVMLVIKQVLADKDEVGTLIFDEIDTGISGHAALKVGKMLRQVSKNRQVVCVTHLAQIAAAADNHLLIEKQTNNGRTFTGVHQIEGTQQVGEIARIMAGGELTESILKSAKELLDRSKTDEDL